MKNIEFYKHNLSSKYNGYTSKVLNSDFLTSGNICKKVEFQIKNFFNVKYALLTNSWTNGALAVLMALNIKRGDEVIVPAMTFVATSNVVEMLGAKPRFVDVDKETLLMDFNKTLKSINKRTKAIMPVHLYGNMIDIKKLSQEVKKINKRIKIIEDCAHCFEGKFKNYLPGKWSDCAIFSFYATKNITCGEGGAIITNNQSLNKKVSEIRIHGMTKPAIDRFSKKLYRGWNMNRLGIKANLPDLLACLLPKQISEVYKNHKIREKSFKIYDKLLSKTSVIKPKINKECKSAYHLYVIHLKSKIRNLVIKYLNKSGISTVINYTSVTDLNYYKKKYNFSSKNFPVSSNWGKGVISLPFYTNISEKNQRYVVKKLLEAIKKYD